jgi:hypothetical protein
MGEKGESAKSRKKKIFLRSKSLNASSYAKSFFLFMSHMAYDILILQASGQ